MKLGDYPASNAKEIDEETNSIVHAARQKRRRGLPAALKKKGH